MNRARMVFGTALPLLLLAAALRWGDASGPRAVGRRQSARRHVDPGAGRQRAPDGSRVHLYGPSPSGLLMFDAGGRYGLQIVSAGRPAFAANDKGRGTADEYQAAVQGSNAHFGTYAVDQAEGTITFRIEHASFPNWEGTEQTRAFTPRRRSPEVHRPGTDDGWRGGRRGGVAASPRDRRLRARPHTVRGGRSSAFEAADRANPPPPGGVVFIGSSSIQELDRRGGRLPRRARPESWLWRVHRRRRRVLHGQDPAPYRPRLVVLYAGDNDLAAGRSPERVVADYRAFVARLRSALPAAARSLRLDQAEPLAPRLHPPGAGDEPTHPGDHRARQPADLRRRLHADARWQRTGTARSCSWPTACT